MINAWLSGNWLFLNASLAIDTTLPLKVKSSIVPFWNAPDPIVNPLSFVVVILTSVRDGSSKNAFGPIVCKLLLITDWIKISFTYPNCWFGL